MHCQVDNDYLEGMQLVIKEVNSTEQIRRLVELDEINKFFKGYENSWKKVEQI
jgi:hypothetical protein